MNQFDKYTNADLDDIILQHHKALEVLRVVRDFRKAKDDADVYLADADPTQVDDVVNPKV